MNNPLLETFRASHGAAPFDQIKPEHFLPALEASIEAAKNKIEIYKKNQSSLFKDVIVELDDINSDVEKIVGLFHNLHSAECPEALEKVAPLISEKATSFGNDIALDPVIFSKIKACYESRAEQNLTSEEKRIIELAYKDMVRNGALLDQAQKEELRKIDDELAKLSLKFSQNVLKATNAFKLEVTDKKDLAGLPENLIEAAADLAEKNNKKGSWLFGLDMATLVSFLTFAENRELRKKMFLTNSSRAFGGELDNQENIKRMLELRYQRANLLGYKTHADYVLEERMAMSADKVKNFSQDFLNKSKPKALKEMEKLKSLYKELTGRDDFARYDSAFYAEILKKRELDFNDEMLRPFFQLEKVVDGIFKVAQKLYGLNFKEVNNIPVYHPDVKTFEVYDEKEGFVGLFYADFFPRETKRGGAWMTHFRSQGYLKGEVERPHIAIVCNFTKPTKTKPSLLSIDEVTTLYHEFGHALHGLLANVKYKRLSGTNVFWDFVELPSQMMENWVYEKECLDLFAEHYETKEKIPPTLLQKIKESSNFLEGIQTLRQLSFGILDMEYHMTTPDKISSIPEFEEKATKDCQLLPLEPGTNASCAFSHIFAGGYSAGYYSYKWAEVLDADAFEYFKEKGIFSREVANKFRENILEKGGTEHPMELYKKFRGKEPTPDALLRRAGLM